MINQKYIILPLEEYQELTKPNAKIKPNNSPTIELFDEKGNLKTLDCIEVEAIKFAYSLNGSFSATALALDVGVFKIRNRINKFN